ncbi:MAG: arginase family protein [Candidatus Pacearchaeota archaeon]|nr:arginase family protein [Candidatus Pacearchaeota archaeon]
MLFVKVPFVNGLGKTKGCEKASDLIVRKKKALEIKVDNENIEESIKRIYNEALKLFKTKEKVLFIGGDHSISYPLAKAFAKTRKEKKYLVVFDAHADCMTRMKEPTHEEWLRAVLEEKLFDKIFLIGTRKIEPEEKKFLEKRKEVVIGKIETDNVCCVYLSIDIDVFDPRIAPATGYKEKGGMKLKEFYELFDRLKDKAKAIDLVEVNPEKDLNGKTIKLARELIKRLKEK